MTWFWIISIIVGLAGLAHISSMVISQRAGKLLKKMEKEYEEDIDVLLANAYLDGKNWDEHDREEVIHNCMQMLKPYIDSLLAHINATDTADVQVSFPTKYFGNVATFADTLYKKR